MAEITKSNTSPVKFLKGTQAQYNSVVTIDENAFYYITDTNKEKLYLGKLELTNAKDLAAAVEDIGSNADNIEKIYEQLNKLTGTDSGSDSSSASGSIQSMIDAAVEKVNEKIGDLSTLTTDEKNTLVAAISEAENDAIYAYKENRVLIDAIDAEGLVGVEDAKGVFKRYNIYQGTAMDENTYVACIDVPKDMVVSGGHVEENPEGRDPGTYLVLTINDENSSKVYIPATSLVDIYTAKNAENGDIIVAVDSDKQISAAIRNESIKAEKIVPGAITSNEIAVKGVAFDNLSETVQKSLGLADSSVQTISGTTAYETGSDKGSFQYTVGAKTQTVYVKGLGTAAFTDVSTYDDNLETAKTDLTSKIETVDTKAETNANTIATLQTTVENNASTASSAVSALRNEINEELKNYASADQGKKADSSVQEIITGADGEIGQGTIRYRTATPDNSTGTYITVPVAGLGSAAFTSASDYETAENAKTTKSELDAKIEQTKEDVEGYANSLLTWGTIG
jgi:uncharacterized protein YggU (UPF0235/DUF167 family)